MCRDRTVRRGPFFRSELFHEQYFFFLDSAGYEAAGISDWDFKKPGNCIVSSLVGKNVPATILDRRPVGTTMALGRAAFLGHCLA